LAKNDLGVLLLGLGALYLISKNGKKNGTKPSPFPYGGAMWYPVQTGGTSYYYYNVTPDSVADTDTGRDIEPKTYENRLSRARSTIIPVAPKTISATLAGLETQMLGGAQYRR